MNTRKNQKVIIATLCAIVIGMVVGYAALSQILTITGTSGITGDFKIEFTKIEENTMVNSKTVTTGGIGSTTANFTVDLEKPGSSAIYDLTVENKGTVDAILKSIEGIDESNLSEPLDIKYSIIGIEEGESLNVGATKSFQVKVVWSSSATSIPTSSKSLVLKLNYEQNTGSGIVATPEEFFGIDDTGTITAYTGDEMDIVIPSTINGIAVTKIGDDTFFGKGLTSVVLPNGLKEIGNRSFWSNQLTSVVIPEGVTTIGAGAFKANKLVDVVIPKNVTSIGNLVFADNQLTSVIIPSSVTTIGDNAFSGNGLTNIEIPKGVTSIGDCAFQDNKLTSVVIPEGVTTIGWYTFSSNQLTSVVIPNSVTTIGNNAFQNNKLMSIEIPDGVTSLGDYAFASNQLTSVKMPNELTSIGYYAFQSNKLTSVIIPENVTTIGDYAFDNNSPLTKIVNKTGKPFDWNNILGLGYGSSAISGTYGNVTVTTE